MNRLFAGASQECAEDVQADASYPRPTFATDEVAMVTPLVEMVGIDKSFPGVRALHDARFELLAGEVHALMGENGAGKSTLMKVLSGVYTRDAGEIRLDGTPVEISSPRRALDLGISIIHQELALMRDLTAAQNIFIGREPRQLGGLLLDERALNAQAEAIFASMNLKLDPRVTVGGLTIARQQMVEIAKALSYKSRVLIMDEPTAALNDAEINELFAIINRLKAEGVGIVYISHKMDELKRIADRVTVMRDSEYVGTVPAATTQIETIISMMVGRTLTNEAVTIPDTSQAPVALEVRGLKRGKEIRDVSLSVRKGEILGLAGLMGAGRTEVARAIFGADPIEAGEIFVNGNKVSVRSPQDAVRAGIGYLSEDRKQFGLATGLDVRNNIALASLSRFVGPGGVLREGEMREVAQGYIRQLAIKTPSDTQESRLLSGGNQQKVVIAKWLLRDCDILIFDEPTRGIDVGAKSEIYKLLQTLAEQGRAIIVISSELPEVLRLSHRIAVMCEGRLTGILPGGASQEEIMHLATLRPSTVAEVRHAG
jgi:ribose transport system ATP-binding protein